MTSKIIKKIFQSIYRFVIIYNLKEDCYNKLRFKAYYFFAASGGCPDYLLSRYRKPRPKYEIYNILVCFFGSDSHSDIENRGIPKHKQHRDLI